MSSFFAEATPRQIRGMVEHSSAVADARTKARMEAYEECERARRARNSSPIRRFLGYMRGEEHAPCSFEDGAFESHPAVLRAKNETRAKLEMDRLQFLEDRYRKYNRDLAKASRDLREFGNLGIPADGRMKEMARAYDEKMDEFERRRYDVGIARTAGKYYPPRGRARSPRADRATR